jgi:enoyl-CoA hydratase
MISGRIIPAQEAHSAGLVTQVYAADRLLDEAMAMAHSIAGNAPISVRLVKQVLQRSADLDLESVMQLEIDGMLECLSSSDLREGLQAFVDKRQPDYWGK